VFAFQMMLLYNLGQSYLLTIYIDIVLVDHHDVNAGYLFL